MKTLSKGDIRYNIQNIVMEESCLNQEDVFSVKLH